MQKTIGVLSIILTFVSLIIQFSGNDSKVTTDYGLDLLEMNNSKNPDEKYWILDNYTDAILNKRSIAAFSEDPLSKNAIMLRIEDDSIYVTGTLSSETAPRAKAQIGMIRNYGKFIFTYDQFSKRIKVLPLKPDSPKYVYRSIPKETYDELVNPDDTLSLQRIMNYSLTQTLFEGKYKLLGQDSEMTLNASGEVKGFKKYNSFAVEDYFRTPRPFGGLDAILFEGKNQKGKYFNWKFSSDTLTFTELDKKGKEYIPGTTTYKFLKIHSTD